MKHCEKTNCCYNRIDIRGTCGYRESMEDWELCPQMLENWEETIDKISSDLHKVKDKIKEVSE